MSRQSSKIAQSQYVPKRNTSGYYQEESKDESNAPVQEISTEDMGK